MGYNRSGAIRKARLRRRRKEEKRLAVKYKTGGSRAPKGEGRQATSSPQPAPQTN